jgi:hypothetical protein
MVPERDYVHGMGITEFEFRGRLWRYTGKGAWHFVTLPADVADAIRFFKPVKGFMPVAVSAQLGSTAWKTSVFPDSTSGSFLLAVKAEVRRTECIGHGDDVTVRIRLLDV